jgi:hypothetical protein
MADNAEKPKENGKSNLPEIQVRSSAYPRFSLAQAEKLVRAIFEEGARHCDFETVVKRLGYKSANSGTVSKLKAAANHFGMIVSQGDYVSVSEPWIDVLHSEDRQGFSRAKQLAMQQPTLYQQLIEDYRDRQLPQLDRLTRELHINSKYRIRQDAARDAARVFLESASYADMIDSRGYLRILPNGPEASENSEADETTSPDNTERNVPKTKTQSAPSKVSEFGDFGDLDRIEVQLSSGKKAYLFFPSPITSKDKARLKGYIDLLLEDEKLGSSENS